MKSQKHILSLLLVLCLSIGIWPSTVLAAEEYGIRVNGIAVTEDNKDNVLGEGDQSVTFDPETNTLTLNQADFVAEEESYKGAIVWEASSPIENLTICALGDNTFTRVFVSAPTQRTLTFTGSGSITLTGAFAEMFANPDDLEKLSLVFDGVTFDVKAREGCYGIAGNNVTITNGANVTVKTQNIDAILAFNQLMITGGSIVNASSTDGSAISACYFEPDSPSPSIIIQNSSVTATSASTDLYYFNGIYSEGSLTIQQAEVTASGYYPALFSGSDMTIEDSVINASSAKDCGIWSNADLFIVGKSQVNADGEHGGVRAANGVTVTPPTSGIAGSLWDIYAGDSAENAKLLAGSPFSENTPIDLSSYPYFEIRPHIHTGGLATCTEKAKCDTCGQEYGEVDAANHTVISEQWTSDDARHWHGCACGEKMEEAAHTWEWVIDKAAAAAEKGSKHQECSVCGYKGATGEIPALPIEYKIIEGANGSWTQNSDGTLAFRANGDFSKFTGVKVDGAPVDADNYTAVSGSTVITLKTSYLKALSKGTHTLTVVYTDGECSANFEIKAAVTEPSKPAEPADTTTPSTTDSTKTGDDNNIVLWLMLLSLTGVSLTGTVLYARRKQKANR